MPRKPQRVRAVPRVAVPVIEVKTKRSAARRPAGATADPVRSVRCSEAIWSKARTKAQREGYTPSYVIQTLLAAYGDDQIEMPRLVREFSESA